MRARIKVWLVVNLEFSGPCACIGNYWLKGVTREKETCNRPGGERHRKMGEEKRKDDVGSVVYVLLKDVSSRRMRGELSLIVSSSLSFASYKQLAVIICTFFPMGFDDYKSTVCCVHLTTKVVGIVWRIQ